MKLRTKKTEFWITKKGKDGEAKFLCYPPDSKESFNLVQDATETSFYRNQRFTDLQFYNLKIAKIKKAIIDWEGIEDEDGNPLPCTDTNKELLYKYNKDLIDEVLDEIDMKADVRYKEIKDQEKNSEAGPSGSPDPA